MPSSQWVFDHFRFDPDHACLWRDAEAIILPPKTFAVLHYLVTHPDRLVSKDELLDAVWPETAVTDAVLRVAIGALRKVLGDTAQTPRFIATVSRRGYRFLAPVEEHPGEVPGPGARPRRASTTRSIAAARGRAASCGCRAATGHRGSARPSARNTIHSCPPTAGGGTPPPHCAVLRSGRRDRAGGAPGPRRPAGCGACLPSDLYRGDAAV